MVKCNECDNQAVYRGRCLTHHVAYVEQTVKQTIEEHNLFTKSHRLCVAVSGGKDSQTVLHVLHTLGYNVTGLLIDEGIKGYREPNAKAMTEFCKQRNIPLKTVVFNEAIGTTLDNVAKTTKAPPCTACGAWRRQMLNKHAQGFDVVVTGHNLDDEAQTQLMNIFNGRITQSMRIGIKTKGNGFVPRAKPLYFLGEKDIRLYTLAKGFDLHEDDCPYAHRSFRWNVRDFLNDAEESNPGAKIHIVKRFLKLSIPTEHIEKTFCKACGQPSIHQVCVACQLAKKYTEIKFG